MGPEEFMQKENACIIL